MSSVHPALIALLLLSQPAQRRVIIYDLESDARNAAVADDAITAVRRQLGRRPELTVIQPQSSAERIEAELAIEGGVTKNSSGFLAVLIAKHPGTGRPAGGETCRSNDENGLTACLIEAAGRILRDADPAPVGRAGGTIVVSPLDAYRVSRKVARNVSGVVRIELGRVGGLKVAVDRGDWEVRGAVARLDRIWLVHLELLDPEKNVAHRVSEVFTGPTVELVQATRLAARRLVGVGAGDGGKLSVIADVEGARLSIDGRPALQFSGKHQLDLEAGKHHLMLSAEGHRPLEEEFYVMGGQTTTLRPSLVEVTVPWYEKWWVWTALGAAIVVSGTVVGVTAATRPDDAAIDINIR